MKTLGRYSALLLIAMCLQSCSHILQITLFNGSGETIRAEAAGESVDIPAHGFGRFRYPGEHANRVLRLSSGGCEYLYEVPDLPDDYRIPLGSSRGAQFQVEQDFRIDLLPADYAGDAAASNSVILQSGEYPLRPVTRKCR